MKIFNYKVLFYLVLLVALFEGIWIYFSSNLVNSIHMSPYSFIDLNKSDKTRAILSDDLVTARGSWVSTTELANPLSTTEIECWKKFGHCWIADASIMFNDYLSLNLDLQEIAVWNDDYIETKPSSPLMGCVEETYRLDRRSEVVTYTRKTLNTDGVCEGITEEPIVSKLGDGLERIKNTK